MIKTTSDLRIPATTQSLNKKKRVFRSARGSFMHVKCSGCNTQRVCYSHSQKDIRCTGCSAILLESTGGRAAIIGKTGVKKAENIY